jgi:periplasmic divalent cation tolerance protein
MAGKKTSKKRPLKKKSGALSSPVIFFTTFSKADEADRFAQQVIAKRLASCVNVLPGIVSHYQWQGKIEKNPEILCLGKTTKKRFNELKQRIKNLHSYDTPELVSVKIADALPKYLEWLVASVEF